MSSNFEKEISKEAFDLFNAGKVREAGQITFDGMALAYGAGIERVYEKDGKYFGVCYIYDSCD